jgi:gliding motility-associated-like protein
VCEGESYGGHTQTGSYTDTLTTVSDCDSIRTVDLTVFPTYLEETQVVLCPGESMEFNGTTLNSAGVYQSVWSTSNGCDSIQVLKLEIIAQDFLGNDTVLCAAKDFTITSGSPDTRWFDGSTGPYKTVQETGVYWATVSDNSGCVLTDSIRVQFTSRVYVPNIFSPNDDGINDLFIPQFSNGSINRYHMQVFDRWGDLLFETFSSENGWDGRHQNKPCEVGVYVYIIRFAPEGCPLTILTGDVSLVR